MGEPIAMKLEPELTLVAKAAARLERDGCLRIVEELEQEAAKLIKEYPGEAEYYRGQGLAAAKIIKRIKDRSKLDY